MQVPTSTRWVIATVGTLFAVTASVWWWRLGDVGRHEVASPQAEAAGVGMVILVLLAPLPVAWCYRIACWWRAGRAPSEPVTVRLFHAIPVPGDSVYPAYRPSFYLFATRGTWALIEDATGARWYQRLIWEPWLAACPKGRFSARARRLRPAGPAIITTKHGRLLWAGRPTRTEPIVETITRGPPARGGTRLTLLLPATAAGAVGWWAAGLAGAAVGFSYLLALAMFYGGPPLTRGGRFRSR